MKLDFASELMKNQKHAVVMSPTLQFEVLQTAEGDSLFFSIGTDGVLYCVRESEETPQGWLTTDLSSGLSAQFEGASVVAKSFDVSQNGTTGLIDIALAVTVAGSDRLTISVGNADTLDAWATAPPWQTLPYDDVAIPEPDLVIADLYLPAASAPSATTAYLVVDIVRTPGQPVAEIARYFIDPTKSYSGQVWNPHALPTDLQAGDIRSSLGRKAGQTVDGIYTLGALLSETELIYSPLFNPFAPGTPPPVTRIELPSGATPDATAFALAANGDGTTNLYLAAAGSLYFMASAAQHDGSMPTSVCTHPLLAGVRSLHVDVGTTDVLVWGLDSAGTVFCLRNAIGQELTAPWTVPIPLVSGVDDVATFLNHVAGNRVIFAQTGDQSLVQLTENPETTLWQSRNITLPPTDVNDVVETNTYTTHVQVYQDDNLPAANVSVSVTSTTACSVYINNQYFRLDPVTPVEVDSDAAGTITIVQDVSSLDAAYYNLTFDSNTINVNPMSTAIATLSTVESGSDLDVTVTNAQGQQQRLVGPGVTDRQKADTAAAIKQFVQISNTMPQDGSVKPTSPTTDAAAVFDPDRHHIFGMDFRGGGYFEGAAGARSYGLVVDGGLIAPAGRDGVTGDPLDSIEAAAGDILRWIEDAIDDVSDFFVTVVDDVAKFFVRIADQLYHFVMDCVNDCVRGIEFVLHKIEVMIDELIMWLGFLFDWDDIIRTHRVIKNLLKQFAGYTVDELASAKEALQAAFTQVQQEIDSWTGLPAMPSSIGSISQSASPLPSQNSPQANWGIHHFQNGASDGETSYTPSDPSTDPIASLLADLVSVIEAEGDTLMGAVEELKTQVIDQLPEFTMTEIIERVVALVLDVLLETAENVVVALVDIVEVLITGVMDVLDAELEIPIISWLYKEVTGDDLSFLDLVCLIAAIPATIVFKAVNDRAPFPDDDFTSALIDAPDFAAIQRLYADSAKVLVASADAPAETSKLDDLSYACNVVGFFGAIGVTIVGVAKAGDSTNPWLAFAGGVLYLPYVAPNLPAMVESQEGQQWYKKMNTGVTVVSVVKTLVDVNLYKNQPGSEGWVATWGKISPGAECLINLVWEIPVVAALVDSDKKTADYTSFAGNTAFNLGGIIAPGAAYPDSPTVKAVFITAMSLCSVTYGALMLAIDIESDSGTPAQSAALTTG